MPSRRRMQRQRRYPLSQAPDSWLRLLIKFYKPTEAVLFHFALPAVQSRSPGTGFHRRQEFIKAVRPLGCNVCDALHL